MDTDPIFPPSPISSATSGDVKSSNSVVVESSFSVSRLSTPETYRKLTPPPTEQNDHLLASPAPLTPDAKAKAIIANIKAKARAAVLSSPEEAPLPEFKDDLDSSSDDEDLLPISKGKGKEKAYV
jgi:hypothetical protein